MTKICCFQFIEVLYSRLPSGALSSSESKINSVYCKGQPKTGKELTQAATKYASCTYVIIKICIIPVHTRFLEVTSH